MAHYSSRPHTGFFHTHPELPVFVDVGGHGDCGFRAIAAALLDKKITSKAMQTLWTAHTRYFPEDDLDHQPKAALVQTMAYTLRQMAVDELCKHPEHYRGAFVHKHEKTAPSEMRKPGVWIDESAIAALAHRLNVPITVKVVEGSKTLPLVCKYNEASCHPGIVIRLENSHYMPEVLHPAQFAPVQARSLPPEKNVRHDDPGLNEIIARIVEEDKRLQQTFDSLTLRLSKMVDTGEIDKAALLNLYIKYMAHSDYLRGRVRYIGLEHGHQAFFNALAQAKSGTMSFQNTPGKHDAEITKALIHALARAVSIGHIDENQFFNEALAEEQIPVHHHRIIR